MLLIRGTHPGALQTPSVAVGDAGNPRRRALHALTLCMAPTGDTVAIPGLAGPSVAGQADVDAFLRGQPRQKYPPPLQQHFLPAPGLQRPARDAFAGFEEAYQEGLRRPPTPFPHGVINGDRSELRPFLQVTVRPVLFVHDVSARGSTFECRLQPLCTLHSLHSSARRSAVA